MLNEKYISINKIELSNEKMFKNINIEEKTDPYIQNKLLNEYYDTVTNLDLRLKNTMIKNNDLLKENENYCNEIKQMFESMRLIQ